MRQLVWLSVFVLIGCFTNPKEKVKKSTIPNDSTVDATGKKKNGLIKSYDVDGKLYSAITYKNGIKDGISYAYYPNGQVNLELTYANGKRTGQSKRFYENGKLYQTTDYRDGNMHGWQKKYRENGDVISTSKFEKDEPCLGLKEYLLGNSLKQNFPTIVVTPLDELATKGRYTLKLSMSDKTKKVKFYEGKLSAGGCLHDGLEYIRLDERTGKGEIVFNLPPRGFIMEEINIIARVKTLQGNTYIAQRTYNLAIDN
jgi:antitoxin component YwqK of YwqJK toxin-antitoxin module